MIQNALLIWLDSNIDDKSNDCRNTIIRLRHSVNNVNTFTDGEECIHFLGDMDKEKACMIISGAFGQQIVPLVHNMSQVDSILIFCDNRQYHEQWTKDWSKVKGVFTEIQPICEALKQTAHQCEQNAVSISILDTDGDLSKKKLDQLDPSFMYTQIIKEILLTITFDQHHIQEFIQHCRKVLAGNESRLRNVDKLEQEYPDHTPIWWYTYECFLYSMLNCALRMMNTDLIIKLGFFIGDIHRQLVELHKEQFDGHSSKKPFTVYRGQGMDKEAFAKIAVTKGGLLSFNCFISTSKDEDVSLMFAESVSMNPDMVGVLFVMTIDPAQSTAPFASIVEVGHFGDREEEVLFSMHTVFRIGKVIPISGTGSLFRVELILTSEDDKDLRQLTDRIRQETNPTDNGWFRLGSLLLGMGLSAKAQEVYEILLKQTTDEGEKRRIYHGLGFAYDVRGCYQEAITFYEMSVTIAQQSLPPNHPSLATSYNNIGSVYSKMGNYAKALSLYEKALTIQQNLLPSNHLDLATSYSNIGSVYARMGDYAEALSSYEKALTIRQQSLPPNHPDLATSYNNIGLVYDNMADNAKALLFYEKALTIRQQSLPPNHPDLATSYNNIGSVYDNMGDYVKTLSSYEKALAIQQQSLPPNRPHLATSYNNIGSVYSKMGDYANALSSFKKALTIQQQSLPPNHPDLATSYNNIGSVYFDMGDYTKTLSFYEKARAIRQQSLPPNHPDLATSYNNIGSVYSRMGDSAKALSSHEKALAIQQQSLPPNHPDLATSYNNIGSVYSGISDYTKALLFYEKTLTIQQKSLPPNHPSLATSYNNIGLMHSNMGNYAKAFSYYEKDLEISKQSLPPNHPDLATSYNNIGLVYDNMRDYARALSFYEKALTGQQQSLPPDHPSFATSYNNIGSVYSKMGDYARALSYCERAVNILQRIVPSDHPYLQAFRKNLEFIKGKL